VNGAQPALSSDGRYLAFVTDALSAHDGVDRPANETGGNSCFNPQSDIGLTNNRQLQLNAAVPPERPNAARTFCQVVVRDLIADRDRLRQEQKRLDGALISPGRSRNCASVLSPDASCAGRSDSDGPSLSKDGNRIAFESFADDLIERDTNRRADVFVRTLQPGAQGRPVEFGPVEIGQSISRNAVIGQVGAGPLFIEAVKVIGTNAGDFTISGQTCQGTSLHRDTTCAVTVEFAPGAEGDRKGQLEITVRGGRKFTVDLTGSGTLQPVPRGAEFSANPSPLDFGARTLLSNGPESTVTITNTGESPLAITSVTPIGANPADYTISSNGCLAAVAPGGLCRVLVKFSPKLPGARPAVLQFTDNAAGGPHLVGLNGSGNQPSITVSPGVTTPGRVVTVTGKEFPPGKVVTVKFDGRVGQATVTAGTDGTFRVPLLIFPKATPENRNILATVGGFTDPLGRTQLLIVFPSVSPAEFVVRN
jgi:hypothetical protein